MRSEPSKDSKRTIIIFGLIVAAIFGFIVWRKSPYWPWPSKEEIEDRLDKVVKICTNNEASERCREIKNLYGANFKYCVKVKNTDVAMWYLTNKYEGVYGVAWQKQYKTPNDMSEITGINYFSGYQYTSCVETREKIYNYLEKVKQQSDYLNSL